METQVVELLDHYLDSATPSAGALLLVGPWGAGKTHFIKDYFKRRRDAALDPLQVPDPLYVSLYGIRSLDEVQAQFFAQTNPALNSGVARLVGAAATRALNFATNGQAIQPEDAKKIQGFFSRSLKGFPLVFDDLERCAMPLTEIMGFINSFVEHDGAKVIILASEADVPEDQRSHYRQRKEKLVSKTVEVSADAEAVYDAFTQALQSNEAKTAANLERSTALTIFGASGYSNFRSLRSALLDFDRMVSSLDARLAKSPEALKRLLKFTIAATLEFRKGEVSESSLPDLAMATFYASLQNRSDGDGPHDRLAAIATKYPELDWSDSVVPSHIVAALIARGILDRTAANAAILEHPLVVGRASAPAWRRLWRWFETTDAEYVEVRSLFLDDLANFKIVEPGPILHAVGMIITLAAHGDDLLDGQDPIDFAREYLSKLEARNILEPDIDPALYMDRSSWGGLGFSSIDTPAFELARAEIDAAARRAISKRVIDDLPSLLSQLRAGDYDGLTDFDDELRSFADQPRLHHIDVAAFADLSLVGSRLDTDLIGALLRRYHLRGHRLKDEIPWVISVRDELLDRAKREPAPHKSRLPITIRYWFDAIFKELRIRNPEETDEE